MGHKGAQHPAGKPKPGQARPADPPEANERYRQKATRLMFTAFNINSTPIKMATALRRADPKKK